MLEAFKKFTEAVNQANEALETIAEIRHDNQLNELKDLGFEDQVNSLNEFFPAAERFLKSNQTQIDKVSEIVKKMEESAQ